MASNNEYDAEIGSWPGRDTPASPSTSGTVAIDAGIDAGIDGNGGSDRPGTDSGIGKRRRGRPRNDAANRTDSWPNLVELQVDAIEPDLPARTRRRNSKGIVATSAEIAGGIAVVCNVIATYRGSHWEKTDKDCLPLAEPLKAYLDNVSPEYRKMIGDAILPLSLIVGGFTVFGLPISVEIELAKRAKLDANNSRLRRSPLGGQEVGTQPSPGIPSGKSPGIAASGNGNNSGNAPQIMRQFDSNV